MIRHYKEAFIRLFYPPACKVCKAELDLEKRALRLEQAITADFGYDAISPIPIDRFKRVKRHFTQAEMLAERLAAWVSPHVQTSFLIKQHSIPSQTSLSRQERATHVYGAFKLPRPLRTRGKSFLLLDDVLTTGATANEATRRLKLHSAKRVDLLALARATNSSEKNSLRFLPSADKIPAS